MKHILSKQKIIYSKTFEKSSYFYTLPCVNQNQLSYFDKFEEHKIIRNLADKIRTKYFLQFFQNYRWHFSLMIS